MEKSRLSGKVRRWFRRRFATQPKALERAAERWGGAGYYANRPGGASAKVRVIWGWAHPHWERKWVLQMARIRRVRSGES